MPPAPAERSGADSAPPPFVLAKLPGGTRVTQGSDPGDFYCEHAFFTSTQEAQRKDTSILKNSHGEPLTGFLHVPADKATFQSETRIDPAERHAERRTVVGAALRGLVDAARPQLPSDAPVRVLVTGYGAFGSVKNNPTGDFVGQQSNFDAAMQRGFGDKLVTPRGKLLESEDGRQRLEYKVLEPSGAQRSVIVEAVKLPVDDSAINGGPRSLQARIGAFQPHAVMSMGVAAGSRDYLAEFQTASGGLDLTPGGGEGAAAMLAKAEDIGAMIRPNRMAADDPFYTTSTKRSLYLPVIRNMLPDVLALFDAADPNGVTAVRGETTVASQALFLLNAPFVREQARVFATRLLADASGDDERIDLAHRRCYGRPATEAERREALAFRDAYLVATAGEPRPLPQRELEAWQAWCQVLVCGNEFVYVE